MFLGTSCVGHRVRARGASFFLMGEEFQNADRFAHQIKPEIVKLRASGITSIRTLAEALNKRQVATAAGGQWHVQPVHRLIQRIDAQLDLRAVS